MNIVTKLLCAALLAVSAPVWAVQADGLQGKWHCLTRYDDINAETRDHIHFSANGRVKMQGKMIFTFLNHEFHYSLPSRGTWQLQDNLLTLKLRDGKLQRRHPAETRKAIAQNEVMSRHDTITANILSNRKLTAQVLSNNQSDNDPKTDKAIFLRIDELTRDTMHQTQLTKADGEEMAKTACTRREKDLHSR